MKNIIISADGDRMVYSVPDKAAENLTKYCMNFDKWLLTDPHAEKYRIGCAVCYTEADFIEYLNTWVFPNEPSVLVENLGPMGADETPVPEKYENCPRFNF